MSAIVARKNHPLNVNVKVSFGFTDVEKIVWHVDSEGHLNYDDFCYHSSDSVSVFPPFKRTESKTKPKPN